MAATARTPSGLAGNEAEPTPALPSRPARRQRPGGGSCRVTAGSEARAGGRPGAAARRWPPAPPVGAGWLLKKPGLPERLALLFPRIVEEILKSNLRAGFCSRRRLQSGKLSGVNLCRTSAERDFGDGSSFAG